MIIPITSDTRDYSIILQDGALERVGEFINLKRKVLIVTDTGVPEKYSEIVASQSQQYYIARIPMGESSKCFEQYKSLLTIMLENNFSRGDCVVAVGGGVVGDLSGFTASSYMRGVDFYNIPTTLLSQVDSSIGGKTAIDFNGVKNIVGAFYNPNRVIIDPTTLKTLDIRQLHAGLAESIKMAATCDAELFELIEKSEDIYSDLNEIIYRSLNIKKDVVEKDPKEQGLRKVLNFGHTVGHAIESIYNGEMLHGECVAAGMLPMCGDSIRDRLKSVLNKYNLPIKYIGDYNKLLPIIFHDKKMEKNKIRSVIVNNIGSFEFVDLTAEEILKKVESSL
ncbi:MAG: 3-dehydroquinate synthase [Clostridia bacterium]|nr:3-dehydroquinate synthase [Clostridia bacterium]